jgi:hypothetical protein
MRIERLEKMTGGWFIGNFEPSCIRTEAFEVACKHYSSGDDETKHQHRIATEITLIVRGKVKMNDQVMSSGDIIILEPGESSDFQALDDTITMVVKIPSVLGDKYFI